MGFEFEDFEEYCLNMSGVSEFEEGFTVGGEKGLFCYFSDGSEPNTLSVRAFDSVWEELEEEHNVIFSEYLHLTGKGWHCIDLIIDKTVKWELLSKLIDESYQIARGVKLANKGKKPDPRQRLKN